MLSRIIPGTAEQLPVIGLGTWRTFDVSPDSDLTSLKAVINTLKDSGGRLIDCSPMYGKAELIIGELADPSAGSFFYATKVWTRGRQEGIEQMESSFQKMRTPVIDLMQIHNLVDWEIHLKTLLKWKEEGRIRYVGISHYMDSMHSELAQIIKTQPVDFVQFNYSITGRHAEREILPVAIEKGVATLINRPFGEGSVFGKIKGSTLPGWAREAGFHNWSEFFLKFIISHPGVTCVIPATSDPVHATQNFAAGQEPLPDASLREKMSRFMDSL